MTDNVIKFPKENKNIQKVVTIEEINRNVEMMNHYHIQETIQSLVPILFNQLEVAGFMFPDEDAEDDTILDGALIVEAIRSWMLKYYGLYHPMQRIADELFIKKPNSEEYRIADEISIDLRADSEEDKE